MLSSIRVTLFGIVMFLKLVHLANAFPAIEVTLSGIAIFVGLKQL